MNLTTLIILFVLIISCGAALLSPRAKTAMATGNTMAVVVPLQPALAWNYPTQYLGRVIFFIYQSTNLPKFQVVGSTTNLSFPISMTNPQAFYRVGVTWITPP